MNGVEVRNLSTYNKKITGDLVENGRVGGSNHLASWKNLRVSHVSGLCAEQTVDLQLL